MRHLEGPTHYEIGKLRAMHDRHISHQHRIRLAAGEAFEDIARDPEMTYSLDALDALIQIVAPQEHQ